MAENEATKKSGGTCLEDIKEAWKTPGILRRAENCLVKEKLAKKGTQSLSWVPGMLKFNVCLSLVLSWLRSMPSRPACVLDEVLPEGLQCVVCLQCSGKEERFLLLLVKVRNKASK